MCAVPLFGFFSFFALVGGNVDNGTNAGLFYWNLNNASSNANWNIGARLLILLNHYTSLSIALAKNNVETGLA
ncbi:MAG TPA: hypothetical protein DDY53_03900 [Clostridiales bacterium]|jgi:hypothetical protein|nr:MAG TPA: hypothetical protein [Caudoviricetes sp.]HBJ12452.1 hypothetical protein [Clostridiales bacterium]